MRNSQATTLTRSTNSDDTPFPLRVEWAASVIDAESIGTQKKAVDGSDLVVGELQIALDTSL
jgi:hypothetical protein